ncbi:insulinase family protein [Escherichia coli]|uniref:insulinase family protein n=1 Tax=Escherichia coli TaxID=562 RepID=UPI00201DE52A|nr:insulinase family protein [Escherichia coli]
MKRVLIPGVILCGADVAQAVDDKNMYMHFFEEMTVYAPVPVPVNGNTHYTSESIERLPTGNGNISDLLRTNPAVRMDSTQSTSLNQGDIRPEKISIHGASPYQNAYLIDGISATNNLNPANESDASSATNISGMSQGYYLDVSLLDNVTLYDSFVPVEFGRFNGGVIDAKIKRFNADDSKVKLGYRTTRSDWLTSHIDENNKSAFNQGSSGSTYYSPDFKKNFYTLSFNQELADNFGVTAGLSRRQSDITRADYVSNDGIVAGRAQYKNVIDTALSKFTWFASDRFTHDLTLKYTGSSRDYNTSTFPQSDREMGNKSYGLAWDMDTQLAWAKLRTTVGWDHISDYTRHDHDIWYTELSCTYGDITGRCTRGGLGHISQAVDNYTFKTRLDWQKFAVGNVSHQPYFGAEYIYSDAWTERHNQSESYVINAAGKKTNHTIYHKGKGRLGIDNYTLYMADRISWRNVSLMPGVRYDYDNYLSNHNISPRFMTEWDIFANQTSMITAGYNRYYGGNILDMGLRDIRNSWTESVSGNKTLTRYQDLKTPYNDELAMGLQQKIGKNVIARANYVYREAHDQISKSSRTDSATKTTITEYNNDGKTKTHSFSLSFELAEPNAQIQALKTLDQRPAEKFAQQMYETRYADDRTKLLQENQIAQFTAADALAADRQLFSSPADITFVIVGNVAEDKLVALITRYLGSIKHSDSPLAAGKPLTRATDNASVTVKEQNEPVAQVSQWKRYDSRTPVNLPTRMALDAFNVALAKDLRVNIREQASGAYSVSSRLSVDPQAKDISHLLAFTCQPERHDELLTLANEVMVKRLAKGISEQELNEYQQNVQRSLDIQQRSVQQLANTIVNSLIQYDDPAAWTEQEQLLKQMTVENVNTAVKQYLSHPVNTYTGVLLPK